MSNVTTTTIMSKRLSERFVLATLSRKPIDYFPWSSKIRLRAHKGSICLKMVNKYHFTNTNSFMDIKYRLGLKSSYKVITNKLFSVVE